MHRTAQQYAGTAQDIQVDSLATQAETCHLGILQIKDIDYESEPPSFLSWSDGGFVNKYAGYA